MRMRMPPPEGSLPLPHDSYCDASMLFMLVLDFVAVVGVVVARGAGAVCLPC